MIETDLPAFAESMAALGVTFGEEISFERGRLYFEALRDLPLEEVRQAVLAGIRRSKFFPRPAELREFVWPPREYVLNCAMYRPAFPRNDRPALGGPSGMVPIGEIVKRVVPA